jgi:hypothetical protein
MPKRSCPFGTTQNTQRKFFLPDREYLTTVYGKNKNYKERNNKKKTNFIHNLFQ